MGSRGAPGMFLAMTNGDLDGQAIGLNSIMANQPALWNAKEVRVLLQFGRTRRSAASRRAARDRADAGQGGARYHRLHRSAADHGPAVLGAAGILADRAAALRSAFATMVKDREFLADAERSKLDIMLIDGDQVRGIIAKMGATPRAVGATPRAVIERYNGILRASALEAMLAPHGTVGAFDRTRDARAIRDCTSGHSWAQFRTQVS